MYTYRETQIIRPVFPKNGLFYQIKLLDYWYLNYMFF